MSGIKGSNTKPEMLLRRELHRRGFRYQLHNRELPGKPDIVFRKYNAVIFAHGCLWHQHECHLFKWPCADNPEKALFWRNKINSNRERDNRQLVELAEQDWRIALVWECALKGRRKLLVTDVVDQLAAWLVSGSEAIEITGVCPTQ